MPDFFISLIMYLRNKLLGTGLVTSQTKMHADLEFLQIFVSFSEFIGLLNISLTFLGTFFIMGMLGFLIISGCQLFCIFNNRPFSPYKSFMLLFDNI